jgi:hypothetical protein
MRRARLIFQIAGIYGLVVIAPLFFLEGAVNASSPPAITHPEYYYGFAGVTLAWQILFLAIARDPARYRPLIPVAVLEKAAAIAFVVLVALHRAPPSLLLLASVDLILGGAFVFAYRQLAPSKESGEAIAKAALPS